MLNTINFFTKFIKKNKLIICKKYDFIFVKASYSIFSSANSYILLAHTYSDEYFININDGLSEVKDEYIYFLDNVHRFDEYSSAIEFMNNQIKVLDLIRVNLKKELEDSSYNLKKISEFSTSTLHLEGINLRVLFVENGEPCSVKFRLGSCIPKGNLSDSTYKVLQRVLNNLCKTKEEGE